MKKKLDGLFHKTKYSLLEINRANHEIFKDIYGDQKDWFIIYLFIYLFIKICILLTFLLLYNIK